MVTCYDKRSGGASAFTKSVADGYGAMRQNRRVLGSNELLAELRRLRDEGTASNAEVQRLLKLPSSRVTEIFKGDRGLKLDEAKVLVEHYGLEPAPPEPEAPNAENLAPLLDALLPLAPTGRATDQSLRALAAALSYGLALLGGSPATRASQDAIDVAARGAIARFREIALAS